ncbi:hypothetical protein [Cerasicoccus maritimus]|uniref:hypothetical protein n=1 Tax=Cerasicoccus maritimus TaxID=490089 RepID=UPI0028527D7F|nr:hypothetical protein [Cerasicoccus maritimus]
MAKLKLDTNNPNTNPHVAQRGSLRTKVQDSRKKHEAAARNRRFFSTCLLLLVFVGFPAGACYAYQNGHLPFAEPYVAQAIASWNEWFGPKQEPIFRVAQKVLTPGYSVVKDMKQGDKSRDWSDWVDPRFFIICQESNTDLARYFELSEKDYNALRVGDTFLQHDTASWQSISQKQFDQGANRESKTSSFERFPAIYIPPAGTCGPTTKCENQ